MYIPKTCFVNETNENTRRIPANDNTWNVLGLKSYFVHDVGFITTENPALTVGSFPLCFICRYETNNDMKQLALRTN